MRNYIYIVLFILAGCFITSCNDLDDGGFKANESPGNPMFEIVVDTSNIDSLGGERTIEVKTNVERWTVVSNQSWAEVSPDSLTGNGTVILKVSKNNLAEQRELILTFQPIGNMGPKQQVKFKQDGLPATLNVSLDSISTNAYGGFYELEVKSNSSWKVEIVMDQEADLKWCAIVDNAEGTQDGKVTIKIDKNTNLQLAERTAKIKITAYGIVQEVSVKQVGNATCDPANNAGVIYFDSFMPCDDAKVGDTWTLTDRRDNNTYTVRLMEDGQIWMIQDLRFAGDTGKLKANLSLFNGDGISEMEYIPGYLGDVVYPTVKAFPAETGYFYNWMGVMQSAKAVDAGVSQSFVVEEPYQGIAPFGWHIPSSTEYKALDTAFGSNPTKWGPTGPWKGAYGGNVNETASSHWGVNAYGTYWTCTQTSSSETSSSPQQKAHVWKFYSATSTASEVLITQPKKYGFPVRLVKNK